MPGLSGLLGLLGREVVLPPTEGPVTLKSGVPLAGQQGIHILALRGRTPVQNLPSAGALQDTDQLVVTRGGTSYTALLSSL